MALRESAGAEDWFIPVAFGTIHNLVVQAGTLYEQSAEQLLQHVASDAGESMLRRVVEIEVAGIGDEVERFNDMMGESAQDRAFVPAVFCLVIWLAKQIGLATDLTAEGVLQDKAMLWAEGEAGLLGSTE